MKYQTFAQFRSKVERMLDIEVEEFIQTQEFIDITNDGVTLAVAEIQKLGMEDMYFLTKSFLPLAVGQADYALPANIYINKIKAIEYRDAEHSGTTIYTIRRLRGPDMFENRERINQYNSVTDYYKYILRNDSAAANITLELVPPSREDSSTNVAIWFFRTPNVWTTDDSQFMDLPDIALQFVQQYVITRVHEKEGHPNAPQDAQVLEEIRALMIATMEQMVADDDTEVWKDLSIYQDLS